MMNTWFKNFTDGVSFTLALKKIYVLPEGRKQLPISRISQAFPTFQIFAAVEINGML